MKISTGMKIIAWIAIFTSTAFANPAPRFTAFSATANSLVVGKTANYTITFNPSTAIATDAEFTVNFPAKFNLSGVTTGAIVSGINGTITVTNSTGGDSANYVILTRNNDGTVASVGTQIQLRFDGVVNSDSTGDFTLTIRYSGSGEPAKNTTVTIAPDILDHFTLTNAADANIGTQTAGTSFTVKLTAYDQYNNIKTDYSASPALTVNKGDISPSSVTNFSSGIANISTTITTANTGVTITATDGAVSKTSNAFTVNPAALNYFTIKNTSDGNIGTQTAGTSFTVKLTAYDQYNNIKTNYTGSPALTVNKGDISPASATISSNGTTNVSTTITTANTGVTIIATDGAVADTSNAFTVNPAVLDHFNVKNGSDGTISTQTAGTDFTIKITAKDQYENTVISASNNLTLSDDTGTLTPTSATLSAGVVTLSNTNITQTGAAVAITATSGAISDTSNTFTVDPAALNYFTIKNTSDGNITNQTAAAAFTVKLTAYDQYDNIKTNYSGSPALTVNKGDISPSSATISSNGTVNVSTTINTANTGVTIIATDGAIADTSNTFDVVVGSVASIKILQGTTGNTSNLSGKAVTTDSLIKAHAASFDAGNNYLQDEIVSWTLSDTSIGKLSVSTGASTTFDPRKPGTGELQASQSGSGYSAGSGDYTVAVGEIQHVKILTGASGNTSELGDSTVVSGASVTVHAGGYDSDFNYVQDESVTWSVVGAIGTINAGPSVSSIFTGSTVGSGLLKANHASALVLDAYSGTITVSLGAIDHVTLRTAINGGGEVFSTYNMTADESVTIYAAGYDAQNNYIGNESVTWSAGSGTFSPATGATTTFSPTVAENVTVVGTPTAGSAGSAIITVTPGVPVGLITLTPAATALPADGSSETTVTSSIIQDGDANNVGAGKEFTISLGNSALGSILNDANASLAGVQIATDASSKLVFTFRAGSIGGTTGIFASSVDGSANGSTEISLSSLSIISLSTASSTVSRGQQDAQITMTVENNGSQDITITSANPTFTSASDGVTAWTGFENITRTNPEITSIPANGGSAALTFNVDITSSASIDSVIVDGIINGSVSGTAVSDSAAANRAPRWNVQKNPSVGVVSVVAADAIVDQGTAGHIVTVTVNVPGADAETADAVIDNINLIFKNGNTDVSTGYLVSAVAGNPTVIPGAGGNVQLDYKVDILSQAQIGTITIDAELFAHDANSGLSTSDTDGASATDTWTVESSESVTIVSVTPGQATVSADMTKQWNLTVVIDNSSSATVNVTSLDLRFFIGAVEKTSEYSITSPALTAIAPHSQGTYIFAIDTTGSTTGLVSVDVHFVGSDGSPIDLTDANSSFTVQTPAAVSIKEIIVPASATINQTNPWRAKAVLQNTGQADAEVYFDVDSTAYIFSDVAGYSISNPAQLSSGSTTIVGASVDTLTWIVNTTGSTPGQLDVGAVVRGYDKNSDVAFKDSTTAAELQPVMIQTPATLTIDSTYISSLNAPNVNRLQAFQLAVRIKNDGQEALDSVVVSLASDEVASPSNFTAQTAAFSVPGMSSVLTPIDITAADRSGTENFIASIFSAKGLNTGNAITPAAAIDSNEVATIQTPAALQIVQITTSPQAVFANQLIHWDVTVTVKNNGEATALLLPKAGDLTFDINSQNDTQNYTVTAPGTTELPGGGGESDVVYTITRTGIQSGNANIQVDLGGSDKNTGATISASGNTTKLIEENSSVLIIKSEILAPNVVNGEGIVNTGQTFTIRVSVKNNGTDAVKEAGLRLQNQFAGGAFTEVSAVIDTIQPNQIKTKDFSITAGANQNDIGELVVAHLDTATVISSNNGANIGEPVKNEVKFYTQISAELEVRASTNFTHLQLQKSQEFLFKAMVVNRGQANLSGSGQLHIELPAGYTFSQDSVQTNDVNFSLAQPELTWRLVSSAVNSTLPGGDPVSVSFLGMPTDVNSANPAAQYHAGDTLYYSVGDLELAIDSIRVVSPAGSAASNKISSGSTFTIRAYINGWRRLINTTATLFLPSGFVFSGGGTGPSPITPVAGNDNLGQVDWTVVAPSEASVTESKSFGVTLKGFDGAGTLVTRQSSLSLDLVPKALLQLVMGAGESTNLSLAMGQEYDLRVILQNLGSAGVTNKATIVIDTSNAQISFAPTPVQSDTLTEVNVGDINSWRLQMPNRAIQTSVKVRLIDPRPLDNYTGQQAAVFPGGDELHINISVRETGSIIVNEFSIFEPVGAIDNTISTDQEFKIKARLTGLEVKDVNITLRQENGNDFIIANADRTPTSIDNFNSLGEVFEWSITAPAQALNESFVVSWNYKDATSGDDILTGESSKLNVITVRKAAYSFAADVVAPASATDKIVSPNQAFTIEATINKLGMANLQAGSLINVRLKPLPPGYETNSQMNQSVGTLGGTMSWLITAPDSKTNTETIEFELFSLPIDENSGETVEFSQTNIPIPIRTKSGQLELREMYVNSSAVIAEGQEQVELLRLGFTNKGDEFASLIDLFSIRLDVFDQLGEALVASEVLESLSAKRVVADTQTVALNTSINPVDFNETWVEAVFPDTLKFEPDSLFVLAIYGKIKAGTKDKKFSLRLSEKSYVNAQDHGSQALVGLELVDKNGNGRDNLQISSNNYVVVGNDFSQNFFNYPNPFNPNTGSTQFSYTLQQASDVIFDVYTLFGELVYHREFSASDPQGMGGGAARAIVWNGRNGANQIVLSGIYVAYIKAGSKIAKTTVAVIR